VTRLRAERVPHIGWNTIDQVTDRVLARAPLDVAYSAHGYVCRPEDEGVVTAWTTESGDRFPAIVRHARTVGVQFHPEKSSRAGVDLLAALVEEALK
jgi:glutamine amidotransferase